MSTYLGYKDHGIHDMSSLVDEAQTKAHGQSDSGNDVAGAGSGIPYNTPSTKCKPTTMLLNTCSGSCENLMIDKKIFKNNLSKLIFITNTQQIILYVLKRTVSMRRRFLAPKTHFEIDRRGRILKIILKIFVNFDKHVSRCHESDINNSSSGQWICRDVASVVGDNFKNIGVLSIESSLFH